MRWQFNDGGREASGLLPDADHSVARAIAIALEQPYSKVYAELTFETQQHYARREGNPDVKKTGRIRKINKTVWRKYMRRHYWKWIPTMRVGQGCTVHLRKDELPPGRLLVVISQELTAVIDGEIQDVYDPSRGGTRCVYGYYRPPNS